MEKVKICGLRDGDTVRYADRAGADWIGFVFVEASPRAVTTAAAASLLLQVRSSVPVALLVDPDDAFIEEVAGLGISVIQLHGRETPARIADIKSKSGLEIWKAIGVSAPSDLEMAADFIAADRLLIDAKPPEGATRTGGHGAAFDWSILQSWTAPKPWILAGGLTPDNVAGAIRTTGADAVDVSSGVEAVRGVKSPELISAFITAARGTQHH